MAVAPTVADALAGAQYRGAAKPAPRSVLLAGASGRLGERVLGRLLASSAYQRIHVLTSEAMPSTESKLVPLPQTDWRTAVDDVIVVVSDPAAGASLPRKRTDIFSSLAPDAVLPLAEQARQLGVSRFMLVTPIDVLSQPSAIRAQLADVMEAQLHQLGFSSLLLVRPSDYEIRQRAAGIGQRFWSMLIHTVSGLMAGERHTPMSMEDTAKAVVQAMLDSAPGLQIIEMDRLHQLRAA